MIKQIGEFLRLGIFGRNFLKGTIKGSNTAGDFVFFFNDLFGNNGIAANVAPDPHGHATALKNPARVSYVAEKAQGDPCRPIFEFQL